MWSILRRARTGAAAAAAAGAVILACPGSRKVTVTVVTGPAGEIPVVSASVDVVATSLGAITDANGVAVLTNVPTGTQTVRVRRLNCPPATATVPAGDQVVVSLWPCADVVRATNAPTEPLLVLLDARVPDGSGTRCANDTLLNGTGTAVAPYNILAPTASGSTCFGAVAIMTADRAMTYAHDPTVFPWTDGIGDTYAAALPDHRLRVPIAFFISDASATNSQKALITERIRDYHLATANELLRTSLSGLELAAAAGGGEPPIVDVATLPGAPHGAIGTGCDDIATIRATPAIYDAGRMNVYYVAAVTTGGGGGAKGYACVEEGAPNIVFMDWHTDDYYTLTHELGHAFGITSPDWGHSNSMEGFVRAADGSTLNVMAYGGTVGTYFSVGQAMRMNVGEGSWLNRPSASDGSSLRARAAALLGTVAVSACGCPETARTNDCPALSLDVPRSGTLQPASAPPLGCVVSLPSATECVAPLASKTITATITSDGTTLAAAPSSWVNLDPAIVSAAKIDSDLGHSVGEITGVVAGTGRVRAYAGGPFTTLTVTVTAGPCPAP